MACIHDFCAEYLFNNYVLVTISYNLGKVSVGSCLEGLCVAQKMRIVALSRAQLGFMVQLFWTRLFTANLKKMRSIPALHSGRFLIRDARSTAWPYLVGLSMDGHISGPSAHLFMSFLPLKPNLWILLAGFSP